MPAQFTVLNTVLASPSDVQREREIVAAAVTKVNGDTAHPAEFHIRLIRWEVDSYAGFHELGPQGLIDGVLQTNKADLLIGVFWHRLGSTTSDGKTGSEHEFYQAYESWRRNEQPK